ncbi:hypothetical protein V8E54_003360 [Elaphomyces granulatus]
MVRFENPSMIFPDSLRKTLEVQRFGNRDRVRKVLDSKPSPNPEESTPSKEPITTPITPAHRRRRAAFSQSSQGSWPVAGRRNGRSRTSLSKKGRRPATARELRWEVNEREGRPAQCPWLACLDSSNNVGDGLSRLDEEIKSLERYLIPNSQEQASIDRIFHGFSSVVTEVLPHAPQMVGSRSTGMALSYSNLNLLFPATRPKSHFNALRDVEMVLQQQSAFHCHFDRSPSRLPVVTWFHCATGLQLRISCVENLSASVEKVKLYWAEYPELRPLYVAIRMILEVHGVFGSHNSSIRPYGLLLLIIAVLKLDHNRWSHQPTSLGEQLLHFLHTYSSVVDFRKTGVAVEPPGFFNSKTLQGENNIAATSEHQSAQLRGQLSLLRRKEKALLRSNHPWAERLCIQDPDNYMKDLGSSCLRSVELQRIMAEAHQRLQETIATWNGRGSAAKDSVLASVLKANFTEFEELRNRITRYG